MTSDDIPVTSNGGIVQKLFDGNGKLMDSSIKPRNISEGNISIVGLKRRVGLISGTALIVGTMIGKIYGFQKLIIDSLDDLFTKDLTIDQ